MAKRATFLKRAERASRSSDAGIPARGTDLDVSALLRFHATHGTMIATATAVQPASGFRAMELTEDPIHGLPGAHLRGDAWHGRDWELARMRGRLPPGDREQRSSPPPKPLDLEAEIAEERGERPPREEAQVGGERIEACLEAADEHIERGQAPVRRRGDREASARPQYPAGLGEQELDVAHVLEGLGAEDEVVARVRRGYRGCQGS